MAYNIHKIKIINPIIQFYSKTHQHKRERENDQIHYFLIAKKHQRKDENSRSPSLETCYCLPVVTRFLTDNLVHWCSLVPNYINKLSSFCDIGL